MFNFKKVGEVIKKVTSTVLTATLSLGMFSASPINAMKSTKSIFPVAIIGNTNAGKTGLFNRIWKNDYKETRSSFGTDVTGKEISDKCTLQIYDVDCRPGAENISVAYLRNAIILAVAYDDESWKHNISNWLKLANKNVNGITPVKIVLTKSDIDAKDRKFERKDVERYLENNIVCKNLNIDTTVIETSAKNNTGINHEENEARSPRTCLEDYLLDLFDEQQEQLEPQRPQQPHQEQQQQPKTSIFEKAVGVAKKHLAISIGAAVTLATVFVITPLVIFKNKIIKGVKTISAKIKNRKPVAKKIRTV